MYRIVIIVYFFSAWFLWLSQTPDFLVYSWSFHYFLHDEKRVCQILACWLRYAEFVSCMDLKLTFIQSYDSQTNQYISCNVYGKTFSYYLKSVHIDICFTLMCSLSFLYMSGDTWRKNDAAHPKEVGCLERILVDKVSQILMLSLCFICLFAIILNVSLK